MQGRSRAGRSNGTGKDRGSRNNSSPNFPQEVINQSPFHLDTIPGCSILPVFFSRLLFRVRSLRVGLSSRLPLSLIAQLDATGLCCSHCCSFPGPSGVTQTLLDAFPTSILTQHTSTSQQCPNPTGFAMAYPLSTVLSVLSCGLFLKRYLSNSRTTGHKTSNSFPARLPCLHSALPPPC